MRVAVGVVRLPSLARAPRMQIKVESDLMKLCVIGRRVETWKRGKWRTGEKAPLLPPWRRMEG